MIKLTILPLALSLSLNIYATGFNKYNTSENSPNHDRFYGYRTSSGIVRKGSASQRFEIRHGDCGYDK